MNPIEQNRPDAERVVFNFTGSASDDLMELSRRIRSGEKFSDELLVLILDCLVEYAAQAEGRREAREASCAHSEAWRQVINSKRTVHIFPKLGEGGQ